MDINDNRPGYYNHDHLSEMEYIDDKDILMVHPTPPPPPVNKVLSHTF
jgi:hypothetical protein